LHGVNHAEAFFFKFSSRLFKMSCTPYTARISAYKICLQKIKNRLIRRFFCGFKKII